jgi:sigma-B regulation protein RsbU (phosphoserine phosphatase)
LSAVPTDAIPPAEVGEALLGAILLALGAAAALVSALRRRRDLTLFWFGLTCGLYGARLMLESSIIRGLFARPSEFWRYADGFITYVIVIPATLFAGHLVGRGAGLLFHRLWQVQIGIAILAIGLDLARSRPESALWLNQLNIALILAVATLGLVTNWTRLRLTKEVGVMLAGVTIFSVLAGFSTFAPGVFAPRGIELEPFGFLVLLCCLGYVAAVRVFRTEARLLAIERELDIARRIQASLLPQELPRQEGIAVASRYLPMAAVGGDFYDVLPIDDGRTGLLIADVSGHGVPAALLASMVKLAVATHAPRVVRPAGVLHELNRALCGKLTSSFVTSVYALIDARRRTLVYANGGHPPVLVWRHADRRVHSLDSHGMMLGFFDAAGYEEHESPLEPGDRIVMYTDGIIEATDRAGSFYERERLERFMADHAELRAEEFASRLLDDLASWSGRSDQRFDDDVTLVVVDVL